MRRAFARDWPIMLAGAILGALTVITGIGDKVFGYGLVGLLIAGLLLVWVVGGPEFRAAFRKHWSSTEIAKRLNTWNERNRRG